MPAKYQILCRCAKSFARPHSQNPPGWLKANLKSHWSEENLASQLTRLKSLRFFHVERIWEREVKSQPHNTLAFLKAKILELMANMDREVFICSYKKFWSRIKAVVDASGDFIK